MKANLVDLEDLFHKGLLSVLNKLRNEIKEREAGNGSRKSWKKYNRKNDKIEEV